MLKKTLSILLLLSNYSLYSLLPADQLLTQANHRLTSFLSQKNTSIPKWKIIERAHRMQQSFMIRNMHNADMNKSDLFNIFSQARNLSVFTMLFGKSVIDTSDATVNALIKSNQHSKIDFALENFSLDCERFSKIKSVSENVMKLIMQKFENINK